MPHVRFPLGKIVGTPGALAALERNGESSLKFLARHQAGDWSEVDAHDQAENETSLEHSFRLLSAYTLVDGPSVACCMKC
jgi:hypothetical protein